jgi:hypothetical protein
MIHEPVAGHIRVFVVIGDNYLFTAGTAKYQHRFELTWRTGNINIDDVRSILKRVFFVPSDGCDTAVVEIESFLTAIIVYRVAPKLLRLPKWRGSELKSRFQFDLYPVQSLIRRKERRLKVAKPTKHPP